MLRTMIKIATTLVLAAGFSGGLASAASAAAPASQPVPQCTFQRTMALESNPARIVAVNLEVCIVNGKPVITEFTATISQLNSAGQFVLVASGKGTATYTCKGTTTKTYMGEGLEENFACG